MYIALSLVGLLFLSAQCCSRAVSENARQYPVETILYQPIDQRTLKQDNPIQQVARSPEEYHYQYETETRYEPNYSERPATQIASRIKQGKQLPVIEQYLKEVTPTTKTAYEPRNAGENKKNIYAYQAESQQQPLYQQDIGETPKKTPVAQNILAYQNAIIAQQNAIYEQQRADQLQKQQAANPNSAIYLAQNVQNKTPSRKPETSTLDEEIEYYTKLQYQQQQNEPARTEYQTRIPQNSRPGLSAAEHALVYQPKAQHHHHVPTGNGKPSAQLKEQVYLPDMKYQQNVVYQPVQENEEVKYYDQPQLIRYQLEPVGGTYASNQKQVKYQESEVPSEETLQKYRANVVQYHTIRNNEDAKSSQHVPEEQPQPNRQSYQAQQYSEPEQTPPKQSPAYLGPTEEEYRQSKFKQSLGRNSSLRVLKTGRPVVFIGHEE